MVTLRYHNPHGLVLVQARAVQHQITDKLDSTIPQKHTKKTNFCDILTNIFHDTGQLNETKAPK
jgi:hypothetical protein